MRHIPEDELHAYLDQGLSRTQCVEIESHLADCPACRASRDRIAALRDRTTALLSRLAPPLRVPPAFESVRRRAAEHATERRRRLQSAAWAASLVAAVGLGWTASSLVESRAPQRPMEVGAPLPPAPAPAPVQVVAAQPDSTPRRTARPEPAPVSRPTPARPAAAEPRRADSARAALLAVLDPAPPVQLSATATSPDLVEQFEGRWRTMSWDGAQAAAGAPLPHIDGLPVLKVQVQEARQGTRPLMVVAQQLASGQVIQTIEGPSADVSQLLARRGMSDPDGTLRVGDSLASAMAADQTMAMQLGDRMLAITGALPSDSLRAMIRRLNAEMRSK